MTATGVTYTEILPARKSSQSSAIQWAPATDNESSQVAGTLVIDTDRARVSYRVEEYPTGYSARGFLLFKLTPGTDAATEFYTVRCHAGLPEITGCSCKGAEYAKTCKHIDSLNALVANEWI